MKNTMTLDKCIKLLKKYNMWRRGADIKQPSPKEIGITIEYAVEMLETIQKSLSYNDMKNVEKI